MLSDRLNKNEHEYIKKNSSLNMRGMTGLIQSEQWKQKSDALEKKSLGKELTDDGDKSKRNMEKVEKDERKLQWRIF